MNAIDLFAGCGGLSKGFMDAGFDIIVGVDNDQDALNTFALNHNGAKPLNADLSKQETFDEIKKIAGDKTIDVIIAGPPCQGFSLTGPRNFDDERNKLYLAVIEMVKQYKPKAFIIENVPGMATLYKGQIKEEILKRFRDMGYNIDCEVLKACDYGVPQMRKRLIFMGIRKDLGEPCFPEAQFGPGTDRPYRTCREAISDLPTRHVIKWDEPSNLIPAHLYKDGLRHIHPDSSQCRTLTVREAARLQTFADDYIFEGSNMELYKMIGNAVPSLAAKCCANAVYDILTENGN